MQEPSRHKHLRDTLNGKFIVPILLGISISLISTCTCLILLTSNTLKLRANGAIVEELQYTESQPIILASEIIIQENYQIIINSLAKIEAYANFLNSTTHIGEMKDDSVSKTIMKQFIENHTFNYVEMRELKRQEAEAIINQNKNFEYALWLVNERINSIQHVVSDIKLLKLMYLLSNLIPLFNSLYESLNLSELRLTRMYIASPETNLFFKYPMYFDKELEIAFSGGWCLDDKYNYPHYYYFQCRLWYNEAYRMMTMHHIPISITEPRLLNYNTFEVTICILSNYESASNMTLLYCIDTIDEGMTRKLNNINNLLSGSVFAMRIDSKLPIYYPNYQDNERKEYDQFEFAFNTEFSLDEQLAYSTTTYNDYITHNDDPTLRKEGTYLKNGQLWRYNVMPVFFYYDYNNKTKFHLINLIYTENKNTYSESIEKVLTYSFVTLFSPILIYALQGLVLVLIAKYLVNAIASSIVLPMKNIKKTLEKLNTKKHLSEAKKKSNKNKHDDEDKDKIEEEDNEDDEDDEEYINVRSKDIQDLFVRIIELKDSLATLNLRNDAVTTKCLPNYIFATEVFKQRKKTNAYLTCNANVGNLLINCDKYDIAIMHLIESENNDNMNNSNDKENNCQGKSKIRFDNKSMNQPEDKSAQERIKHLLESRYPKLIYCFKQYFSTIKKLNKEEKQNIEIGKKIELYTSNSFHHIQLYESTVRKYQELAKTSNQAIRVIYSNLESIEYYIKYEIKNKQNVSVLPLLKTLFEETHEKIKEKKHFLNAKRVYKSLLNKNTPVDSIEVSKDILYQRLYYLQGYLAICCKNYHSAIDYFFKVTETKNNISDAKLVVQSFKKLIQIAEMFRKEYSNTRFSLERSLLDKFIFNKQKEIKKFVAEEKDVIIVINTYTNGNPFFIKASFDKAKLIYENYLCAKDRFGIMLFGNDNINLITKLESIKDTEQSDNYIQLLIQYGRDDEFAQNCQTNQEEDIESMLIKIKAYIAKKSSFEANRKLFIILFSHSLSKNSIDYLSNGKCNQILRKKADHLIIVIQNSTPGSNNEIELPNQLTTKNNTYDLLRIDNIVHNLKSLLRIYGNINDNSAFSMEKSSNL